MINKNDELILKIESMGINGEGVARHEGAVVFVPYAATSELVKAKIIFVNKSFYVAKLIEILEPSSNRIMPPCPYFYKCGGCDLQHLIYSEQLTFKTNLVKNNFNQIAKINPDVLPTMGSSQEYYYRNKFSFPIGKNQKAFVGMYKANSHEIIEIENCLIQQKWSKNVISIFNKFLNVSGNSIYNEETKQGLIKHLVCRREQNQLLVCVVINGKDLKNKQILTEMLASKFGEHFGFCLNINTKCNNEILSDKFIHIFGLNTITLINKSLVYEVSINSFLQVNTEIADAIYNKVVNEVKNEIVVNAYSGAGLLSALLCRSAKHVYGIEIVSTAHINAETLKQKNNISNLTNYLGDVAIELSKIENFETIVLDPPRKGCDKKVIDTINMVSPNKIIYISCASNTLARDIANLNNYEISYVQPFDMFPQTKHVETLIVLNRKIKKD